MMPAQQVYRFKWAMKNSEVQITMIPRAGHFAGTDQPDYVSASVLDFISRVVGKDSLADVFLGFDGIWKGDEKEMIKDLREIYKIGDLPELSINDLMQTRSFGPFDIEDALHPLSMDGNPTNLSNNLSRFGSLPMSNDPTYNVTM
ncbi:unnamed protein product [marine sediment metagenome]|uniref:Uncharacterized protein n=1 Tax=marine sediment metagenome TaxID=412755 RepID=X1BFW2_9ZZZZ